MSNHRGFFMFDRPMASFLDSTPTPCTLRIHVNAFRPQAGTWQRFLACRLGGQASRSERALGDGCEQIQGLATAQHSGTPWLGCWSGKRCLRRSAAAQSFVTQLTESPTYPSDRHLCDCRVVGKHSGLFHKGLIQQNHHTLPY